MKKILTFALCVAAVGAANAQKANVDAAKKLAGKVDKIEEARQLIQQAIENPETAKDAQTYYIAGKIEFEPNKKELSKLAVQPNYEIDQEAFNTRLINGYPFYMAALMLDSQPNEKGEVKPKYAKDIIKTLHEYTPRFYDAGAYFYNHKKFFPEAYTGFRAFGDLANNPNFGAPQYADSTRAEAYFLAGICAYSDRNQLDEAAEAFSMARQAHHPSAQPALYEVETWNNIMRNDSTREAEALQNIRAICEDGFNQFGLEPNFFISRLVDLDISDNNYPAAEARLNDALTKYPDNAHIYGLLGYLYDREGNNDKSEEAYRKAAALPGVDFDTQLFAARKLYNIGVEKLNNCTPAERKQLLKDYMVVAKGIAESAQQADPDNVRMSSIEDILERINYLLDSQL